MSADQQSTFEGFAILEIFGHQKYAGYVKTEYYGGDAMFRCDVPPLMELEKVTRGGCYVEVEGGRSWVPPGSTVKQPATEAYSKLFGIKAIYAMTPCDEKACLAAVAELQPRPLILVKLPEGKAIAAPEEKCPACGETVDNCGCLLGDDEDTDPLTNEDQICPVCREPIEGACQCPPL